VVNQTDLNKQSVTDASGEAGFSWTPSQAGNYLVEVKLLAPFNVTVSQNERPAVYEPVCAVSYVQVMQRPVDLNATCETLGARYSEGDMYWSAPAANETYVHSPAGTDPGYYYGNYGPYNDTQLLRVGVTFYEYGTMGMNGLNRVFETYVRFDLPPSHPDAQVTNAQLTIYGIWNCSPSLQNPSSYEHFGAYVVNQSWSEENITTVNPDGSAPSVDSNINSTCWVAYDPYLCSWELSFNVTRAVQLWYDGDLHAHNFGFCIKDLGENTSMDNAIDPTDTYAVFEGNSTSGAPSPNYQPQLSINYNRPVVEVTVKATDPVAGGTPISDLWINGYQTNASGEATWQIYPPNPLDPLGVVYEEVESSATPIYAAANFSAFLDTRYVTLLNSSSGNVTSAYVGLPHSYSFRLTCPLCPSLNADLAGVPVAFWLDHFNASDPWTIPPNASSVTNENGLATLNYDFGEKGTYYVYAYCDGYNYNDTSYDLISNTYNYSDWFQPCNATVAVAVSSIPLGIDFSVSPNEFAPDTSIRLNATVIDLWNNTVFAPSSYSYTVNFTEVNPSGAVTHWWAIPQENNGKFIKTITYPSGVSAYAYEANIVGTQSLLQSLASSPVQLAVGTPTRLLLNVTRDFDSTRHVFLFRLLNNSTGMGVAGRTITLKLNSTYMVKTSGPTNATGWANVTIPLSPQANNNATVFNVVASFSGDSASTATASMTTLNGTTYDVCTTTQYNTLEPSSNSTSITVTPQTTTGATTLMGQEQMEANAKASGQLSVYNEFSLLPPWYRLHVRVKMNGAIFDVGFNPLLPLFDVVSVVNASELISPIPSKLVANSGQVAQVFEQTFLGTVVEGLGLATALIAVANTHIPGASLIALGIYGGGIAMTFDYAYNLYVQGESLRALSLLVGIGLDTIGTGFGAFLGATALDTAKFIVDAVAFPVLGSVLSNMVNPSPVIVAMTSTFLTLAISMAIGFIIERYVPDPSNSWFLPAFIITNFVAAILASNLYESWSA